MSHASPLRILPYHPSTVVIDGHLVHIRVARFDLDNFKLFRRDYNRIDESAVDRVLAIRMAGDEEARRLDDDGHETFIVSDDEIARRRLSEMTPAARAAHQRARDDEEDFAQEFIRRSVTAHVTVEPRNIEITDDTGPRPLTEGAELVQYFGGRREVMRALMVAIWVENTADETLKNVWRSRFASSDSSGERDQVVSGGRLAPPVMPADDEGSVEREVVTASIAASPSGAMVMSS